MLDLSKEKTVGRIIERLKTLPPPAMLSISGSWASFVNCFACSVYKHTSRSVVVIHPHIDDADSGDDDIISFSGSRALTVPAWESSPDLGAATDEISAARLKAALEIEAAEKPLIINASIQALCRPMPKIEDDENLKAAITQTIEPELIESRLIEQGYERVECVDLPGQFARRGGIIDIFSPVANLLYQNGRTETGAAAVRIEFFGDTIESIREIDLDNQHSKASIEAVQFLSGAADLTKSGKCLLDLLPKDTIVIFNEPVSIQEAAEIYLSRVEDAQSLFSFSDIYQRAGRFTSAEVSRFAQASGADDFKVEVVSIENYISRTAAWTGHKESLLELANQAASGKNVLMYCQSVGNRKRVAQIIKDNLGKLPRRMKLLDTMISGGFELPSLNTILAAHHEIFGQSHISRPLRSLKPAAPIDSYLDLDKGDYVVHISHGIGRFLGVSTIEKNEQVSEFLELEFANSAKIYVPVSNISMVHKYIGSTPAKPSLSSLGGKRWQAQKQKVADSIEDMAVELLELQAKRKQSPGISFDKDTQWQTDFEQSFPYEETPDQSKAIERIKKDMESTRPMDMLLCGDVGYGKTEIAIRAAFKAVQSGKQVAVLVPTTVLCVQHGRTFRDRLADFPVNIEMLNRFKTSSEAAQIIRSAREGNIDILIGTHRLLSKDVGFKDLGLLIIDEEQRFGVAHKEKLKKFRVNVDVLTLTATPIPRTLHLSLLGLRDIATLSTPPLDRRSVATSVNRYDKNIIRSVVNRELSREGQIFFLHNRVRSISRIANELREMFPDVRVDIVHGQMPKHTLEKAMLDFVLKKTDILVCTTIIESGLDIPSANTIIIDGADNFGLAQLHQLRGRVGRYKYRAYAQLFLPPDRPTKPIAARRLKAIEEFSQLGAGFKIALRDLEIRGAGNILGAEQSGHIDLVGYEMYCRLLSEAVKRLTNQPVDLKPQPLLNLGFSGHIPKSYIPGDRQRMAVYRKISAASSVEDLRNLEAEIKDLFGNIPEQVILLLDTAQIRVRAAMLDIRAINIIRKDLVFTFAKKDGKSAIAKAADIFAKVKEKITVPDDFTIHLKLTAAHFEPKTLLAKLRSILG